MPDDVRVLVDDAIIAVPAGSTVAAALMQAHGVARRSLRGALRGPLCGMGICHECRVTIDGVPHQRACMRLAADGLVIRTGAGE
jgi:aerobic-type carbon monoxide dehydrogenase small subunit (CoxS/CutS family)